MKAERIHRQGDDMRLTYSWLKAMIERSVEGGDVLLSVGRPKRNNEQNALMWALLDEIATQVEWHGMKLSKEDWKEMLTASLRKQRAVPGIDGGFVILGSSTRKMTKAEFSELIELIYAFGAEHGVTFREEVA